MPNSLLTSIAMIAILSVVLVAGCVDETGPAAQPTIATRAVVVETTPHAEPDEDAVLLKDLARRAMDLASASTESPVLQRVEASGDSFSFHFKDNESTVAVMVTVPRRDSPGSEWAVVTEASPLFYRPVGPRPGIDLEALVVGPEAVKRAAKAHWEDCQIRGLGLFGRGQDLTWNVDCNLREGVVAAYMDGKTGAFTPVPSPPVPTATPAPAPSLGCSPSMAGLPCTRGVQLGEPYPYQLYAHCGVRWAYFDGRWWKADPAPTDDGTKGANPPAGWGNPSDYGTMMLLSEGRARYTSNKGHTAEFEALASEIQRNPGSVCY